jgi:hypothetical protein
MLLTPEAVFNVKAVSLSHLENDDVVRSILLDDEIDEWLPMFCPLIASKKAPVDGRFVGCALDTVTVSKEKQSGIAAT